MPAARKRSEVSMYRRISFAIASTLIAVSMMALGWQGVGMSPTVAAQASDCGPWLPYADVEATPQAEPVDQDAYQVLSAVETIDELAPDQFVHITLTQAILFDGEILAVLSDRSSVIRVDSGLVQITICDGSQVEIQQAGTDRPTRFGAGTFDIPAGGAITVDAGDRYFLASASTGTESAEGSATPTAATSIADGARAGSTLTIVTWGGVRLAPGL